jgi:hypothetical protein
MRAKCKKKRRRAGRIQESRKHFAADIPKRDRRVKYFANHSRRS